MRPLVTINGQPIDTEAALRESIFFDDAFLDHAVVNELIRQHAGTRGISNTDAELQLAADEVRYSRGLEHKIEYEAADVYSIRVESESKAGELHSQIVDEGANFHVLAMEHSEDEESRHLGGYVGRLTRADMTGSVEAAVFAARQPDLVGPIKTEHGWNLFKVARIHRPTLAESESRIRLELMQQLIDRLIAEAAIGYPVLQEETVPSA